VLEAQHFLDQIGLHTDPYLINVVLPVGISFYTFHGMSYVIDIYRGNFKPVRSFVDYSVFVSFFPLLIAGPIERATHLLPQIQEPRQFKYEQGVQGLRLILWGFFKKVVIANTLAPIVDDIFNNYTHYSGSTLVLGAVYFAFQIYGDFSGYTDIALGVAKLFGFELLSNFKFPYFSRDLAEFWRRWHVSLSSWFRDYVYIPLGGSRSGTIKAIRNVFIIFLISGFWHGANWTFITWGGIHALGFMPLLLLSRNRKNTGGIVAQDSRIPSVRESLSMLATFAFVTFAWVFFRSESIHKAVSYLSGIHKGLFTDPPYKSLLFLYILPFIFLDWCFRRNERELSFIRNKFARYALYLLACFAIVYHSGNNSSFIYFQF
jgi:D-alanyl-lipoteichoic acid acyltransferase DltB (MBOAT superfamily)